MRLWEMYNIPRNKMPQINKKHLETYPKKLMVVDINSVTPSQSDRVPGMVDKTLDAFKRGEKDLLDKPMVVDRDMNIVNGHHRYDALKKMGMSKVPVLKVDATLPELIKDFSHTTSNRPVKEVKYTEPQLDVEWEEANRYPYLAKLGQAGWVELAKQGKAITVDSDSVKKIGNTGADGSETLDDLEPDKVDRLNKSMKSGTVEMPIVVKQPDGSLELVAGNTRLIGLINKQGKAVVWYVDASNLDEATDIVNTSAGHVLLSDYVKNHISTHNKPGMGSVFSQSVNFKELMNQISQIPIQGNGGAYTIDLPRAGYNLVLPIEDAKRLPGAKVTNVKKDERGGSVTVPAITTSAPIDKFATNKLTVVVRPTNPDYLPDDVKQNKEIADAIKQGKSYSVVTAFPGDELPPASQWNGKYAVIIPSSSVGEGNKAQKGIPANATDAELRKARKAGGDKGKRAHWLLNMRKGNRKKK